MQSQCREGGGGTPHWSAGGLLVCYGVNGCESEPAPRSRPRSRALPRANRLQPRHGPRGTMGVETDAAGARKHRGSAAMLRHAVSGSGAQLSAGRRRTGRRCGRADQAKQHRHRDNSCPAPQRQASVARPKCGRTAVRADRILPFDSGLLSTRSSQRRSSRARAAALHEKLRKTSFASILSPTARDRQTGSRFSRTSTTPPPS